MDVVRTIASFYPKITGPAYQAREISRGLINRGHRSPILTTNEGVSEEPQRDEIAGVPVYRFRQFPDGTPYVLVPGLLKRLAETEADLFHAHGYRNFCSDAAALVGRRRGIPLVVQTHGTLLGYDRIVHDGRTWPYELYDTVTRRHTIRRADRIVVSTCQERQEAREFGVPDDRIEVVPVGKDVKRYQSVPHDPPDEKFRLLFVGRLDPSRNVEVAIRAMEALPEAVELQVVGGDATRSNATEESYVERLRTLARELSVSDRVRFTGPKYDEELVAAYRSAHAFVYTSRYENFGQTVLEAAAAGLPVIATPEGVAPDLVEHGETGYLVSYDDPSEVVDAVTELRDSPHRRMGRELQEKVRAEYDWGAIVDDYQRIYRDVLNEQPG